MRLLAKVKSKEEKRRYLGANGLEYAEFKLEVSVVGSAVEALAVPARFVGKERTVRRHFLLPWLPRSGDLLVLDGAESARILKSRRGGAELRLPSSGVCLVSADVDGDGYQEDVLANRFVSAAFQPHRGARLWSLKGADGVDRFAHPEQYTMAGKYILLGGAELVLLGGGSPGEIWKSPFERTGQDEVAEEVGREASLSYARTLKEPRDVRVEKRVALDAELPIVVEVYGIRGQRGPSAEGESGTTRGQRERPSDDGNVERDGKKEERQLTPAIRMSTAVLGDEPSLNLFEIPCADGLHVVRFHPPGFGRRWRWRDWRDEHFGLRGGFLVSRSDVDGHVLAVLFNERRAAHLSVRNDYTGPEVSIVHRPRKFPPGRILRTGVAYLACDEVAVGSGSLLAGSLGRPRGGVVPVAIVLRARGPVSRHVATVSAGRERRRVTLRRREIPEAGRVYAAVFELPRASFPVEVSVRAGEERLTMELEA